MSGDGSIILPFADGEYRFRLGIGELRELQEKTGVGPMALFQRLGHNLWHIDDVREPIRLGLIGGGMNPTQALAKVGRYVAPGDLMNNVVTALHIVRAALMGDPEDQVGKKQAAAALTTTPAGESDSANSSEPPPRLDGRSMTSTAQAFGNSPPPSMAGTAVTEMPRVNGPTR